MSSSMPINTFSPEVVDSVVKELAKGKNPAVIVKGLEKNGWNKDMAVAVVNQAQQAIKAYQESPEGRQVMAAKYKKAMVSGILWAVGGTLVTVLTYNAARSGGGTYFIAWGAVVFGLYDFFRGLVGWLKYRD